MEKKEPNATKMSKTSKTAKASKPNKKSTSKKVALGVGLGASLLAAGAAGYYFFASDNAKKNRKIAAAWANNLKKDVEEEIKSIAEVNKAAADKAIEKVVATYTGIEGVGAKELKSAASELKKNWKRLVK